MAVKLPNLKACEDIDQQSCANLQTFVRGGGSGGGGGCLRLCPAPTIQMSVKLWDLEELSLRQFSTNHFKVGNITIGANCRYILLNFSISKVDKKKNAWNSLS